MLETKPPPRSAGERQAARLISGWVGTTFGALAARDFRYLWLGNFASQIGVWLQAVAQGWLAYTLTDSGAFLGMVGVARALPSALITLPAGVLADRWDRRQILVLSQLIGMVNAIILAWLVATGAVQPWHLLATSIVSGITQSFNVPARQSLAPELAGRRHIANAVALNAISFNSSRVVGPAFAGLLIGLWGIAACFIVQALGFVWAMAWTLAISRAAAGHAHTSRGSLWRNLTDGLRYMRGSRAITSLLLMSAVPISLGMVYLQLMPIVARDVLDVGASGLGALMSAVGVGSLLGSFASAVLSHHSRPGLVQVVSAIGLGATVAVLAASHWLAVSLVVLVVAGTFQALTQAVNQTLLNLVTPNEYRGRMMSVYLMTWNFAPFVWLPAGWLADQVGAPLTIVCSGALVVVTTLLIGTHEREIRELAAETASPPVPAPRTA